MSFIAIDGKMYQNPIELRSLYADKKFSTYKIASLCKCDPKTVYRYLKIFDIPIRHKKRIIISKEKLQDLYIAQKLPLSKIAHVYGFSPAGILKRLKIHGIQTRSYSETSTKHIKTDFNGSLADKAYLVGFRIGDLGVRTRGNLLYISSGTTKTAQANLIKNLFAAYGPLWVSKRSKLGAVNISCALNRSFGFLSPKHRKVPKWILSSKSGFFSFVAGYTDAEGNIMISNRRAKFRLRSCDKGILYDIHIGLVKYGVWNSFGVDRVAGINSRGAKLNRDCWFVIINEMNALFRLLSKLEPLLRHAKRKNDAQAALKNVNKRIALRIAAKHPIA